MSQSSLASTDLTSLLELAELVAFRMVSMYPLGPLKELEDKGVVLLNQLYEFKKAATLWKDIVIFHHHKKIKRLYLQKDKESYSLLRESVNPSTKET